MPIWGMKSKKKQYSSVKKFKKIIVVEDHFQDGGFQSWLNEAMNNKIYNTKILSKSISPSVINKVGSKDYLMKSLK